MSSNELHWLKREVSNRYQHTSSDLMTSEVLADIRASSGDISLILYGLPEETLQKFRDCYVNMIWEVRERLQDLYGNILIKLHGLNYGRHEKSENAPVRDSEICISIN
jgi:hypothetical protein